MGRKHKRRPNASAPRRPSPEPLAKPLERSTDLQPPMEAATHADRPNDEANPVAPPSGFAESGAAAGSGASAGSGAADASGGAESDRPVDWARLEQRWLAAFHGVVWIAAACLWLGRGGIGGLELDAAGRPASPSPPSVGTATPGEGRTTLHAEVSSPRPPTPQPPRLLVDVNRAPAVELALLPGVGETLAVRIVEHRTKKGAFTRTDQLLDVPGLGFKTLERLKPLLVPLPVAGAEVK